MYRLASMVFLSHVLACSKSEPIKPPEPAPSASSEKKAEPPPTPAPRVDWNQVFADIPPPSGSDDAAKNRRDMLMFARASNYKWTERDGELIAVDLDDMIKKGCTIALMVWWFNREDRLKEAGIRFGRCGDSVLDVAKGSVTEPPPPK